MCVCVCVCVLVISIYRKRYNSCITAVSKYFKLFHFNFVYQCFCATKSIKLTTINVTTEYTRCSVIYSVKGHALKVHLIHLMFTPILKPFNSFILCSSLHFIPNHVPSLYAHCRIQALRMGLGNTDRPHWDIQIKVQIKS